MDINIKMTYLFNMKRSDLQGLSSNSEKQVMNFAFMIFSINLASNSYTKLRKGYQVKYRFPLTNDCVARMKSHVQGCAMRKMALIKNCFLNKGESFFEAQKKMTLDKRDVFSIDETVDLQLPPIVRMQLMMALQKTPKNDKHSNRSYSMNTTLAFRKGNEFNKKTTNRIDKGIDINRSNHGLPSIQAEKEAKSNAKADALIAEENKRAKEKEEALRKKAVTPVPLKPSPSPVSPRRSKKRKKKKFTQNDLSIQSQSSLPKENKEWEAFKKRLIKLNIYDDSKIKTHKRVSRWASDDLSNNIHYSDNRYRNMNCAEFRNQRMRHDMKHLVPLLDDPYFIKHYTFSYEYDDGRSENEVTKIAVTATLIDGKGRRTPGYVMFAKDITNKKKEVVYHAMFEEPRRRTQVPQKIAKDFKNIQQPVKEATDDWQYIGKQKYDLKKDRVIYLKKGRIGVFIYPKKDK